jgi:hypothetical protein
MLRHLRTAILAMVSYKEPFQQESVQRADEPLPECVSF